MDITTDHLKDTVVNMGLLVKKILTESFNDNVTQAEINEVENKINEHHTRLDDNAFKFLALKRPLARDLRLAIATMKINTDLERIGDQAFKIKRLLVHLHSNYSNIFISINEEVTWMLDNALESFIHGNIKLAFDVIAHDRIVNEINRSIFKNYMDGVKKQTIDFDEGLNIIQIAKNLERIGDHAKNIAEDVIFLESGKDIRHGKVEGPKEGGA
jgi:phosphate transport system protein